MEHTWIDGKCAYCGANQRDYDRGEGLETHAYTFIHTDDTQKRLSHAVWRRNAIRRNHWEPAVPRLGQSGGEAVGSFAMPIYQKFVEAAKGIEPRYLIMVTPSRSFASGRGLDDLGRNAR